MEKREILVLLACLLLLVPQVIAQPSLSVNSTSIDLGSSIQVSVSGGTGKINDWVGLFHSSNDNSNYIDWFYLNGQKAVSVSQQDATLTFTPNQTGTMEFRFFSNDSFDSMASVSFIVTGGAPKKFETTTPRTLRSKFQESFLILDKDLLVSEVRLAAESEVQKVQVKVSEADVGVKISGNVVKIVNISSNIPASNLYSVSVDFRIEKSLFDQSGLDPKSTKLLRLTNKIWTALPTTLVTSDAGSYVFRSDSPGLSTFAIIADNVAPKQKAITETGDQLEILENDEGKVVVFSESIPQVVQTRQVNKTLFFLLFVIGSVGILLSVYGHYHFGANKKLKTNSASLMKDYIQKCKNAKFTDTQIKDALVKHGYDQVTVEKIFSEIK